MKLRRKWIWLAAVALVPLVAVGIAWAERRPLAKSVIADELEKRGVAASYTVRHIGTKLQRIENIRIGDPAHPDLTAEWAEIDTSLWLFGAKVKAVRAGGVRLRGELIDGVPHFGALDKLLPKPTGEPFTFPDLDIALTNSTLGLVTPNGTTGFHLEGKGNPAQDFAGRIAGVSRSLSSGGCTGKNLALQGDVRLVEGKTTFAGPISAEALNCSQISATRLAAQLEATLGQRFDSWTGNASLKLAKGSASGTTMRDIDGSFGFDGTKAQTGGGYFLTGRAATVPKAALAGVDLRGDYTFGQSITGGFKARTSGSFSSKSIVPDQTVFANIPSTKGGGTPVGPIADQLTTAIRALSKGGRGAARYAVDFADGAGQASLSQIGFDSQSGTKVRVSGEAPVTWRWPKGGLELDGSAEIAGGGLPSSRIRFDGKSGTAIVAPMVAGDSRLALEPVRFRFGTKGLVLDTVATLDGSVGTGRISGLRVPIGIRPGTPILGGCQSAQFSEFAIAGLTLASSSVDACLSGDEARILAPKLFGKLGNSPIILAAQSARIGLSHGDFWVDKLAVKLSGGPKPTVLDVPSLSGSLNAGNAFGRYAGASGHIGAVPLIMTEASGDWRFDKGVFTTKASARISDAQREARFYPLITQDFAVRFAGDKITASGIMRAPKTGDAVAHASITHTLKSGIGSADLDTPSLTFGDVLQPDELTPITKGVVQLVVGTLSGKGRIDWTPQQVTSSGVYRTEAMDLAAAFGPVTGIKGEIQFTDLLGLVTKPDQSAKIFALNPGIAVLNGEIRYRLLPGLKAQIDGGRWPFLGGTLSLEPTIFDLTTEAQRNLTFKVEGMDMARFITAMDFPNISATGVYDGTLPMIFDKDGGRIEGGRLVARGGGTLAYVGEISNENLGPMGRFAFDALKSIKYSRLAIDLNGALDGDVITRISFAGVNQAPIQGIRAKFPFPVKIRGLNNFPFIFNVTITARFRELFDMTRTFSDPSILIERLNPKLQRVGPAKTIQPSESEAVRERP